MMKRTTSILLLLVLFIGLFTACGKSGPDLTEVTKKYNEAAAIFNEAAELVNANGWKDDADSLKQHNELANVIEGLKVIIEDPKQVKDIDVDAMSKNLDGLISALEEYKAAVSVVREGYATDAQKKEMVDSLVQMFNGVNTDFTGMVALLDEKKLIVEGTQLEEDLHKYTVTLQEVHDGLTGETMTSADAEEFLNKIEATDKFIGDTIEEFLTEINAPAESTIIPTTAPVAKATQAPTPTPVAKATQAPTPTPKAPVPTATEAPVPTTKPTESVTLVKITTEQNMSIQLPSNMTKQEDYYYADTKTGDTAAFYADRADESYPMSAMTQQEFADYLISDRENLVIISYENNITINGNDAVVCQFSFTSPEGNAITGAIISVLYKKADYVTSLTYSSDNKDGALAKSLQTCIDSISVNY